MGSKLSLPLHEIDTEILQEEFVALFDTESEEFNFQAIVDRASYLLQQPGVTVNGTSRNLFGRTALQMAVGYHGDGICDEDTASRRHEACRWLLQQGAIPDCVCYTHMLYFTMTISDTQLVGMLLSNRCNIECQERYFLWSVMCVRSEIIDYHENIRLLFSVVDKNLADGRFTPCFSPFDAAFSFALLRGYDFLSVYCLSLNCDPDSRLSFGPDSDFDTVSLDLCVTNPDPLSLAIRAKSRPMINLLLHLGCRVRQEHRDEAAGVVDADLQQRMSQPHSLQTLCLKSIRRALRHQGPPGQWYEKAVESLPLPKTLKNELMLKDLKNLLQKEEAILHGETYSFGFDQLWILPSDES